MKRDIPVYLGRPCKGGHLDGDSRKTLRRVTGRVCVACYAKKKTKKPAKKNMTARCTLCGAPCGANSRVCARCSHAILNRQHGRLERHSTKKQLNPDTMFLGKPCKRGHLWMNSGKTRRYLSQPNCVDCSSDRVKRKTPTAYEANKRAGIFANFVRDLENNREKS